MRQHRIPALFLLTTAVLFMAHVLIPSEGLALGSHDMYGLFYPWLELLHHRIWAGESILWDSGRFVGYPFLSNPQIALFYPPTWLTIILPVRIGISLYLLFHLWLSGFGMYRFVTSEVGLHTQTIADHKRPWLTTLQQNTPALVAALCFMFSGFYTSRIFAGHMGLIATHAWVPWLLWATRNALHQRTLSSAILVGLPLGLAILAGHTTSLLYIGLIWGVYALFSLATPDYRYTNRQRFGKIVQTLAIASGIGLLLSSVQLLPLLQFIGRAGRTAEASYEFATNYSFPPAHLITLLIPTFFGEPTYMGYWSVPLFEELTAYIGILPLIGLFFAFRRPQNRQIWVYLSLIILGILLAFGSYGFLYRIFYDWLPPFRLARAPGRAMFLYVFAGSALLGHVLADWQKRTTDYQQLSKTLLIGGLAAGLIALASVGASFAAVHPTDSSGRLWHQLGGWGTAVVIWGAAAAILQQRSRKWVPLLLLPLALADLWLFGYKLQQLNPISPAPFWQETADLLQESGLDQNGRILPWGVSIFEQNGAGQVGLNSIFGYNALEVGAISALTSSIPDPRASSFDILAADYVVANVGLEQYQEGEAGLMWVGERGGAKLYQRPGSLPVARLVSQVEVIPDQQAAISRLHQPDFEAEQSVIIAEAVGCEVSNTNQGEAVIEEQRDGYWRITTASETPAFLVLSESAYPGWQVTIDGEAAVWVEAYTAVRAVCVPAGVHEVIWQFQPAIFLWGGLLSLLAVLCIIFAIRQQGIEPS